MRFKLCGDLDAPEWLLKEISILAKISSVRVKFLCRGVLRHLEGEEIDYSKVAKWTSTANLDASDVKAMVAALTYILSNAAKYDLDLETLFMELQQMGMPKEHCIAMSKPYTEHKPILRRIFAEQTLKLPRLESADWRVDYIMSSSQDAEINEPVVQLHLDIGGTEHAFHIDQDKFRVFVQELRAVRAMMENIK